MNRVSLLSRASQTACLRVARAWPATRAKGPRLIAFIPNITYVQYSPIRLFFADILARPAAPRRNRPHRTLARDRTRNHLVVQYYECTGKLSNHNTSYKRHRVRKSRFRRIITDESHVGVRFEPITMKTIFSIEAIIVNEPNVPSL